MNDKTFDKLYELLEEKGLLKGEIKELMHEVESYIDDLESKVEKLEEDVRYYEDNEGYTDDYDWRGISENDFH